jgi:hypothetical protein
VRWTRSATALAAVVTMALGAACSDGRGSHGDEAFCEVARELAADDPAAAFGRFDPTDPAASDADLERAVDQLRRLQRAAPGDVRPDVTTVADVADDLADALGALATDPDGARAELTAMRERLAAVEAASTALVAEVRSRCGVDLQPVTPPS